VIKFILLATRIEPYLILKLLLPYWDDITLRNVHYINIVLGSLFNSTSDTLISIGVHLVSYNSFLHYMSLF
jgi:hypothetical protein